MSDFRILAAEFCGLDPDDYIQTFSAGNVPAFDPENNDTDCNALLESLICLGFRFAHELQSDEPDRTNHRLRIWHPTWAGYFHSKWWSGEDYKQGVKILSTPILEDWKRNNWSHTPDGPPKLITGANDEQR